MQTELAATLLETMNVLRTIVVLYITNIAVFDLFSQTIVFVLDLKSFKHQFDYLAYIS